MSSLSDAVDHVTRYTVLPPENARTPVLHELEIKRSRFLGYLLRVSAEDEAREFIAGLRKEHHEAAHVCSAFVLGPDRLVQRSNDDGEPSGTAGLPMLEALTLRETHQEQGQPVRDLSDICAVVVRYFGGIKLGAGGLVRAYSDAVSATLETVALIPRKRMLQVSVAAPHAEAGRWENELRNAGQHVQETKYLPTSADLQVALPDLPEELLRLEELVASLSGGTGTVVPVGRQWTDLT